jgi:LruC domain-containing protein
MKVDKIIILLVLCSTIVSSCFKLEPAVEQASVIESVDELNVPANFDWKTTQTLNVAVVLPNEGDVQPLVISNKSGTKIYFRGYPDDQSRTVNTIITIPSYEKELKLIYNGTNELNIDFVYNGSLLYDFNTTNKSAKKSAVSLIDLGLLANFTLYSASGAVSNVGISDVTGDIGTNLGIISGFGTPSILNGSIQNANSVTSQAALDLNNMVTQIVNTVTTNATHAPAFGAETLTPGVYATAGAASVVGTLTLDAEGDADAQFIFKIGGAFTTAAASTVVLINGASSENVFWLATGAVAMAASTKISGNIIGNPGAVSLGNGGELNGRMLSVTGAVSVLNARTLIPLPSYKSAVSSIDLGLLANFTVYSASGAVSNVGISDVTGDIGTNLGIISGFGTPSILNGSIQNANSVTSQAALDLNNMVTQIVNTVTTNATHAPAFGAETLTPGVYATAGAASVVGTLTLDAEGDADAQFIFKIGGAFTTAAASTVVLINGASSENVFWLATGAVAMAASTKISGNIIGNPGAVSLGNGGELNGRMLSVTGAVSVLNARTLIPLPSYSGTLAFEDLYPGEGDFDLNDLVVDYDFNIVKNQQEVVQSMTATFVIKAFGASLHNGFAFTLPNVYSSDVVSVNGTNVISNSVFSIASNGLENGQSKATIIVFDDTYRVMPPSGGGTGANTQLANDNTEPVTLTVNIVFANDAITFSELNIGTFNPFMIVGTKVNGAPGLRGREVHLPNYEPSDLFDTSYFQQFKDDSSPAEGRYFVTANNMPWALNISEKFDWVIEAHNLATAYHKFLEWAQSGGVVYPDWHLNNTGFRDNSLIYN